MSFTIAAAAAALFGIGTYLVLQRKLSRIIIGLGLITHGANVLLIGSGKSGIEPLIGTGSTARMSDPLPHALALTSIVITFGVTALLLAMAFRSWILTNDDEVENDAADLVVARGFVQAKEVTDEVQAEDEADDEELAASTAGEDIEDEL